MRAQQEVAVSVHSPPYGPGIPGVDRRLYLRRVTYHYPKDTPLEQVLAEATRQTGVPLRLDEGIFSPASRLRSGARDVRLYEFMQSLVDPGRIGWVRKGDDYRLVPLPEPE